jgi:hypothetical protein
MSTGSTTTSNQTGIASQLFSGLTQNAASSSTFGSNTGTTTGTQVGAQTGTQAGNQSTTMASTDQGLTSLFNTLVGGGGAQAGIGSLTSIAQGGNIANLNQQLLAGNQSTFAGNVAQIKESFGASGMGSSSSLGRVLAGAAATNAATTTSTLAGADLQAQQQQLSAGQYLSQIFSGAANNYYAQNVSTAGTQTGTSGSTTGSQSTESSIKQGSSTDQQSGSSTQSSSPLSTALSIFGTLFA